MKKFFQIAAWVIVIGGVIVWWQVKAKNESKIKSTEQATEQAEQVRKETTRKAIIELADKYNAVVNWSEPLNTLRMFTIELEDALLRKDNRPVLFFATIGDIKRKEGKYLAYFHVDESELEYLSTINVALDCSGEQVKKIIQQQNESKGVNYVIIATINKVKKVTFSVNPEVTDDGEEIYGEIKIDTSDTTFVAIGHLVDLLFIENYDHYDLYTKDKGE